MKTLNWRNWGITARLIVIAMVPMVLMFIVATTWSYLSRLTEIQQDLHERGDLIARTLAESSQYGMISGNLEGIERTVQGLLQVDKSIYRIELQDAARKTILQRTNEALWADMLLAFAAPVMKEQVQINIFDEHGSTPHISARLEGVPRLASGQIVGYVYVTMSPATMVASKRRWIAIGSAIAATALLASALLGLYLALDVTRPLAATIVALREIRNGNYMVQLDVTAGGEIGELQATIVTMTSGLHQARKELESKVAARTWALEQARDEAVKADAEKRRLIQKVTTAVEEERQHIAVDIHDHLNSALVIARLESQRILDLVTQNPGSPADEEIQARARSIIILTLNLYELARGIVKRLRPETIDTLGLRDAVDEMVRSVDRVHPKCRFGFQAEGDFSWLEGTLTISAYRLIQEALSNVVKHSNATAALIDLRLHAQPGMLEIRITDNGHGFDPKTVTPGIGLIGMRERVVALDGSLDIESAKEGGTVIQIALPAHRASVFCG